MKNRTKHLVHREVIILMALICLPFFCGCNSYLNHFEDKEIPVVVIKDTSEINQRVAVLEEEYERLSKYQIHTDTLVERSYNATNNILVVLSVIIAAAAIYLTWFINNAEKKLRDIEGTITNKQNEVEILASNTSTLLEQINKDTDGLFERIRRKDTEFLLERLIQVPQDIVNIERVLLARELKEADYKSVKEAYDKLCSNHIEKEISGIGNQTYQQLYMVLFYKHFFGRSLKDNSLRNSILDALVSILDGAFLTDVTKANSELAAFVSDQSIDADRGDVLYIYINSLRMSKFQNDDDLIASLKKEITDQELWSKIQKKIHDEE